MIQEYGSQGITLVIGGTGKTGRRVVDRLVEAGRLVRIGSRTAELPFDWEKQDTWEQVLQDVKAAYVTYQPDLAVPAALATVEAFFERAIAIPSTALPSCSISKRISLKRGRLPSLPKATSRLYNGKNA